jgi:hypothetical protein
LSDVYEEFIASIFIKGVIHYGFYCTDFQFKDKVSIMTPLRLILRLFMVMYHHHANLMGLKLEGAHSLPVSAVQVNILADNINTIREHTEGILDTSKQLI